MLLYCRRQIDPLSLGGGNSMRHVIGGLDPEATHNLCVAFDNVCSTIAENDRSEFVKELIARQVIALAERGERDPDKLAHAVSSSLELRSRMIS